MTAKSANDAKKMGAISVFFVTFVIFAAETSSLKVLSLCADDSISGSQVHPCNFTGLLGCVLRANDARLLDAIAPVISDLQEFAGCWFDDALIAATLRAAGELV